MKKIIPLTIAIIPLIIAVYFTAISCGPEESYLRTQPASGNSIGDFIEKNRMEQQVFTVSGTSGGVTATSKGTKIYLPPNGFVTDDGSPVNGNITVSVKEIYTPMEMILNNMPTVSGSRLLESGGEFQIKVSQQNKNLKLAPGNFIKISIPDIARDMRGMTVFNGVAGADGNVNWVANTKPGNFVVGDSTLFANANLFCDDINWINCDKFINDPTVEFSVYPGNVPSGDSTNVFVHLTGRNSVVKMNWTQGLNYFKSNMLLAVPSTIVGISVKNGQLFASVSPVSIKNGQSVTLSFLPYTEQELKNLLSKLH